MELCQKGKYDGCVFEAYKTSTIPSRIALVLAFQEIIFSLVSNALCLCALLKFLTTIGVTINTEHLNMVIYETASTNANSYNNMQFQTLKFSSNFYYLPQKKWIHRLLQWSFSVNCIVNCVQIFHIVLVFLFYTLLWCFYCCLQQVNARWDFTFLKKFVNKIPTYLWLALVLLRYLRLFL